MNNISATGMRVGILMRALIAVSLLLPAASALAHDARPAYLELVATDGAVFELNWKRPVVGGRGPAMEMALPTACRDVLPPVSSNLGDILLERRLIDCGADGLAGKRIDFPGLEKTLSDVLVRIESADGATFTTLVKASRPWVVVEGPPSAWAVAWQYLQLGVGHILLGFDHLLFVLALLLIVRGWRRLLATVTAFTLAHSITLAAATLGFARVDDADLVHAGHSEERPGHCVALRGNVWDRWKVTGPETKPGPIDGGVTCFAV